LSWSDDKWWEIVGIVNDTKRRTLDVDAVSESYVPFAQQQFPKMSLAVRGPGDPAALAETVRRAVATVAATQPVPPLSPMDPLPDDTLRARRLLLSFLAAFAAIALGLAAIGLYGVLSVQVAQRTRELGIRMALGARPNMVRALVVGHGLRLAVLGVVVG